MNFPTDYRILDEIFTKLISWVPYLIGLLLYLLVSYLIFKLVLLISSKILHKMRIEEKVKQWMPSMDLEKVKISITGVILSFLRVFLLMLLAVFGAELFGLDAISSQIGVFISFLPRLMGAIVLFILALSISSSVSKFLLSVLETVGIKGARLISKIISGILLFFISIIAIELVGIDTSIITTNFSIILGAIMVAVAIGIGFGSVEIVRRIFFSFYMKKHLRPGQWIEANNIKGKILLIDGISVTLKSNSETYIIPIKQLVDAQIKIVESEA